MKLPEEVVRHVAKLSALRLSDYEVEIMQEQLGRIIEYVDQLAQVNTQDVSPTSHVHGSVNAFRDDVVKKSYEVSDVRSLAPDYGMGGFRVPKIIS